MVEAMAAGDGSMALANAPLLTLDSEELARAYERVSADRQFRSGQRLVETLAVAAGERVLDVGCGTGLLARHIADRVGPSGYVLGIDPLPLRIQLAQAKARTGLEFRVGNAYALDFLPDAAFDVACLNAVFHWLPEKAGPLRQLARVLRPGGRIGISTGLKDHRTILHRVAAEVLQSPPFSDHPRAQASVTFRVDPQEMRDLFESTGFAAVKIEVQDSVHLHPTAEAMIRYSEASSFGNFLGHLPDHLRPAAREAILRRLEAVATPEGIRQEGRRIVAIATRV
jgi:arsenite methyltransferase